MLIEKLSRSHRFVNVGRNVLMNHSLSTLKLDPITSKSSFAKDIPVNKNDGKKIKIGHKLPGINSNSVRNTPLSKYSKKEKPDETPFIKSLLASYSMQDLKFLSKKMPKLIPARCSYVKNGEVEAYAAVTHEGLIRNYNEDRITIIANATRRIGFTGVWPQITFFGLYDGHAGNQCANYLRDRLHTYVIQVMINRLSIILSFLMIQRKLSKILLKR